VEMLQAIGLSAPAGFNAYLTLLLVGLAGRLGWVELSDTWGERLTNPYILVGLAVLTVWEIVVDKVPGADHINDIAGTVIRPVSGAVLMLATPNPLAEQSPAAAIVVGGGLAGVLHTIKMLFRPLVTATTGGIGNPVVSLAEDGAAVGTVIIAIIAPILIAALIALLIAALWWLVRRWRRRRAQMVGSQPSG
jgi:uncharacterized membrane protein